MAEEIKLAEGIHRKHGKHHVVVDVHDDSVKSLEKKLASTCSKPPRSFTICRVPEDLRRDALKEYTRKIGEPRKDALEAYTPKIVSIGPFHHGKSSKLESMEEIKLRYLDKLCKRKNIGLETCFEKIYGIEEQARESYSEDFPSEGFVQMMVVDGCFIVELLLSQDQDDQTDPIHCTNWMLPLITDDMLLLENQIPLLVLESLWELVGEPHDLLGRSILELYKCFLPDGLNPPKKPEKRDVYHLLDLLHLSLEPSSIQRSQSCIEKIISFMCPTSCSEYTSLPSDEPDKCNSSSDQQSSTKSKNNCWPPPITIPSAMELQEAGVEFCRRKLQEAPRMPKSFLDVTFEQGLIKMPLLSIYDYTGPYFRNFIVFEQCFPHVGNHFSNYCMLMDSLVNTSKDVGILKQSKIIEHLLSSDEEVAVLFNKLCNGISWDPWDSDKNYLKRVYGGVIEYNNRRLPKLRAILVHNYFSNPWASISVSVATFVVILAIIQTVYALLTYYNV